MRTLRTYSLLILLLTFPSGWIAGQQLPLLSQYMMDLYQINPSFAGYDGYTNINLTAHEQWVGLAQSPKTHTISIHSRLYEQSYIQKENPVKKKWRRPFKGGRVGVGASIYDDRSGFISRTGLQLTYAFHIPFQASQLSFGLSAKGFQYALDVGDIQLYDEEDPFMLDYDRNLFIPDADFGMSYTTRDYTIGFSINHLFQSSLKLGQNGETSYQLLRHYYFSGSYTFRINNDIGIQPNVLVKSTNHFNSLQADLNLTLLYKRDYWGGISFRTSNAVILMGGLNYRQFRFGYAFDYSLGNIRKHNFGTHEIIAGIRLGDNPRRFRWLNEW